MRTRPLIYGMSFWLSALITMFNLPGFIKWALELMAGHNMSRVENLQLEAREAAALIILPEYQFIPLLIIGGILVGMAMVNVDFTKGQKPGKLPLETKIKWILVVCLILGIIPILAAITGYYNGFLSIIPNDNLVIEVSQSYLLMTLLLILLGLCVILICGVVLVFYVYWDRNKAHIGLLLVPVIVTLTYATQFWGFHLFHVIIVDYRERLDSLLPMMRSLVIIGQGGIILAIILLLFSPSFLERKTNSEMDSHTAELPPNQLALFVALIIFLPLSLIGWFIPYFMTAFSKITSPPEFHIFFLICVIVGVVFYKQLSKYLSKKKPSRAPKSNEDPAKVSGE